MGYTTPATVVDHVRRHAGERDPLFWDVSNWQPLCASCHNSIKQQLDRTGQARAYDVHGNKLFDRSSSSS
jgi:hypothetical protein